METFKPKTFDAAFGGELICDHTERERGQRARCVNLYEYTDDFEGVKTRLAGVSLDEMSVRLLAIRYANIRKRAHYKCENCFEHKPTQIHHRKHRSQGGNNSYENLIALCAECHENTHRVSGLHRKLKSFDLSASAQERLDH